ncbi:MAG: N-acetylmuramate alpha-1-phosphate uridylyltransferase MurU [Succinivibrionaceae bacterium]
MMKAMILAAGRGERMRPLTDFTPKPLLKVDGVPLIEYHILKLRQIGVKDIVINLAWLGDAISDYLSDGLKYGLRISYSREIPGGLETAGGIKQALPLLGDSSFIVVNGDVYTEYDYSNFLDVDIGDNAGCLFFTDNPLHNQKGDFGLENGIVIKNPEFTFTGMAVYNPRYFKEIPTKKIKMKPYFERWIEKRVLLGKKIDSLWCDVGTPERLHNLEKYIRMK